MFIQRQDYWDRANVTEMHTHLKGGSGCAQADAKEALAAYKAHNYSTVVITNHYGPWGEATTGRTSKGYVDLMRELWEEAAEEGDKIGIRVLYGMEISFRAHDGDFLTYGFNWDFLYDNLGIYNKITMEEFFPIAQQEGFIVFQAHPFRGGYTQPYPAEFLHGLEVFNGHTGHIPNNEMAYAHAQKNHLKMTSGSDFHYMGGECMGGAIFHQPVNTQEDLMRQLRADEYDLIVDDAFLEFLAKETKNG